MTTQLSRSRIPSRAALFLGGCTKPPIPNVPNIVYIMADDLGYGDLSGYGRKDYATPALDKLAAEGTRFTQAYAIAPVCTPTRVGPHDGQYPARHHAGLWEPLRTQFKNEGPRIIPLPL
jgi:arylsulfatase A-like enzyme